MGGTARHLSYRGCMSVAPHDQAARSAEANDDGASERRSLDAAINEAVVLCAHDPAWPAVFEAERDRLRALFPGGFVAIEHIGSTSVADLIAKPVIDIMASVSSWVGIDATIARLCEHGYTASREFNDTLTDRKWLMRWRDGHRTHHLHIVMADGPPWRARLAFRDALRRDAALSRRYAELKRAVAAMHPHDREAYTDAKAKFVQDVVRAELER